MFVGVCHIGQTLCASLETAQMYIDDQALGIFNTWRAGSVYILKEALLSLRHDRIKSALKAPIPRIGATPTSVNIAPRRKSHFQMPREISPIVRSSRFSYLDIYQRRDALVIMQTDDFDYDLP